MSATTRAAEPRAEPAAPPVVAPPPGHPRFPLLDSVRAIAVGCVLLTHTGFLSGANEGDWVGAYTVRLGLGVTIFFLISGFLLYRPFVHVRLNGAPPTRLVDFLRRRFLRIFPAYWLALTLLAIWPGLERVHSGDWWVYYGLLQAYDPSWFDKGIGAAWSLSTEVAFYLVLPLYAFAAARFLGGITRTRQVRIELGVLAALGAASVIARALVASADRNAAFGEASTFGLTLGGTFMWFALGMSMAVLSAHLQGTGSEPRAARFVARWPWVPWLAAAALFVLLCDGIGLPRTGLVSLTVPQVVAIYVLEGAIALGLLLPAVFGDRAGGWPRRVLANRVLAWLGLISYGVFLWHLPIAIKLAGKGASDWLPVGRFLSLTLLTAALAVAAAAASYYVVERPLLRFKYTRKRGSAGARRGGPGL
jgi:peptidoglycan/LPS O-acetylase OafA/YrhL